MQRLKTIKAMIEVVHYFQMPNERFAARELRFLKRWTDEFCHAGSLESGVWKVWKWKAESDGEGVCSEV